MTDKEIIQDIEYYNIKIAEILNKSPMKIKVEFSKSIRQAGRCRQFYDRPNYALITISRVLTKVLTEEQTQNTIIHELCHAYNERHDNHGPHWKRIAYKVGTVLGHNITRTFSLSNAQTEALNVSRTQKLRAPVGVVEVPEIGYKKYIYKKCRGYYAEYKGWILRKDGHKYDIQFTKLGWGPSYN